MNTSPSRTCALFTALLLPLYISAGSWRVLREHSYILTKEKIKKENSYIHFMTTHTDIHVYIYIHIHTQTNIQTHVCMHTCNTHVVVNIYWQDLFSPNSYILDAEEVSRLS